MNEIVLPQSLANNRRLDRWIGFEPGGNVRLAVGKVEIGQGILTALVQIAAEELDVAPSRVRIIAGDTANAPDEGTTSSSLSVEVSGASVRLAAAEVRLRIVERLAQRLNCSPDEITVEDGAFQRGDAPTGHDYWNFASAEDLTADATGRAVPKHPSQYKVVGKGIARVDLPAKLGGAAFIHDIARPGMLHARVVRQPGREAKFLSIDEAAIRRLADGDFQIVHVEHFIAFAGPDETVVQRAAVAALTHVQWSNARTFTQDQTDAAWLVGQPSIDNVYGPKGNIPSGTNVLSESYSRPVVAHAAMGPSCGVAEFNDGVMQVWSHTQGVYFLRQAIVEILGLPAEKVIVRHAHGPGCYGHNGADDAAMDAALIAHRIPEKCIRVQWRREEEFEYEPFSTSQHVTVRAALDAEGRPSEWDVEVWAGPHVGRPNYNGQMLVVDALPNPPPRKPPYDPPESFGGGGTRNALPLYDFPVKRIRHHLVTTLPMRTSSFRSLGGMANVFAVESFIDELAERLGEDPVSYRLSLLTDLRVRRVTERAAAMSNWAARGPAGTGRGFGFGFAQYKNKSAYSAVIAEVDVDKEVRVHRVWCVTDAGLVVNPDGAINQIEGGIVQAISMTLKEQVRVGPEGVESRDWDSYPILKFSEVPEIFTELIDAPEERALGMGECSFGPTAAALGNAVAHALGTRIRDMPLSRERIAAALLRS
ncbi:MAG: xanthine dehydrogenase family protein molybdopterin-binding subunit [Acetobacteraceae bacterium]|nr:xanthine dehydrogenase family protein molybdopterin-binding subunit [Acetobacteraceae bacterium]